MSFKFIIIYCILFFIAACGVKGPPVEPPNSSIPSYADKFMVTPEPEKVDKKESSKE